MSLHILKIENYIELILEDYVAKFGYTEYSEFVKKLESLSDDEIIEICIKKNLIVSEKNKKIRVAR